MSKKVKISFVRSYAKTKLNVLGSMPSCPRSNLLETQEIERKKK
jgi:hypothetical protein